jgi:hypothetical protein
MICFEEMRLNILLSCFSRGEVTLISPKLETKQRNRAGDTRHTEDAIDEKNKNKDKDKAQKGAEVKYSAIEGRQPNNEKVHPPRWH